MTVTPHRPVKNRIERCLDPPVRGARFRLILQDEGAMTSLLVLPGDRVQVFLPRINRTLWASVTRIHKRTLRVETPVGDFWVWPWQVSL